MENIELLKRFAACELDFYQEIDLIEAKVVGAPVDGLEHHAFKQWAIKQAHKWFLIHNGSRILVCARKWELESYIVDLEGEYTLEAL